MDVQVGLGGIQISNGTKVPLFCAECHYWRLEPQYWRRILDRVQQAGFAVVSSFVQPNVHEFAPGKFDFTGKIRPHLDLVRFLATASELGLYCYLRLGPACCEWRNSGGSSFGTSWRAFFDAFWRDVGSTSATEGGPFLLLQVHNEWFDPLGIYFAVTDRVVRSMDGFEQAPCPQWLEIVEQNCHYRRAGRRFEWGYLGRYLTMVYGAVERLNAAWGKDYAAIDEAVEEVRAESADSFRGLYLYMDYIARSQDYPRDNPRRLIDLWRWAVEYMAIPLSEDVDHVRRSTRLPIMHNWPVGSQKHFNSMAHLDLSGIDRHSGPDVDIWSWVESALETRDSPVPFSSEFLCGTVQSYLWGGQGMIPEGLTRMKILSYFAHGQKGTNLYMFVNRDNWQQSPVDERGGVRPPYRSIQRIMRALRDNDWINRSHPRDVVVIKHLPYMIFSGDCLDPGLGHRSLRDRLLLGHDIGSYARDLCRRLHETSLDFQVLKDGADAETVQDCKAIVMPTSWYMERQLASQLATYVRNGGTLIIFPCVPYKDAEGRELRTFVEDLGLKPFAVPPTVDTMRRSQDLRLDPLDIRSGGTVRSEDGEVCGQVRRVGSGIAIALNFLLGDRAEFLETLLVESIGCRKYAAADIPFSDGGLALGDRQAPLVTWYNGDFERPTSLVEIDGSVLDSTQNYVALDLVRETGVIKAEWTRKNGRPTLQIPYILPPRDATVLKVTPQQEAPVPPPGPARTRSIPLLEWKVRQEKGEDYIAHYSSPEIDEAWVRVSAREWTLPLIAQGGSLGVQGWFWLKTSFELPAGLSSLDLEACPRGFQNVMVFYLNGRKVGELRVERESGGVGIDVTHAARPGATNTLAIRVLRQTLECHDVGESGISRLHLKGNGWETSVDEVFACQERRDRGESAGWHRPKPKWSEAGAVQLPAKWTVNRSLDSVWLRTEVRGRSSEAASLFLDGRNTEISLFVNGEYVVKSASLPAAFELGPVLGEGQNVVVLRLSPDNFEHFLMRLDERYRVFVEEALEPLEMSLRACELGSDS
jgi:hypothetical protein